MAAKEHIKRDVIIIGAGMAGLTAALYAGRMNLSVLVLENAIIGGQIANATGIENYPGLPNVSGRALIEATQQQAEGFGAVIDEFDAIQKVNLKEDPKLVETEACIYEAETVIIASGMERRKLPLSEEKKYAGKGVHYCELCDGHMYQDKVIAVMGGGNAAVDAANFLTKYAKKLYLVHRSQLRADEASQTKLRENPKVEIFLETEIKALKGESRLEAIDIFDKASGESRELAVDGIFVNIGVSPHTDLFKDEVELAPDGRIIAGEDCRTKLPGVFAAGDVREKEVRQLTTAAADGTTAAILAEKYITSKKRGNIQW
ncbi:FAD-dependent oxidoreductase [Anaerovibrio sp.]|uniref:NAD(P)/FAD-dependent oxidoreductase n=1 Tax=Anaerovibrio sp. TaxID=1872532 RepID=UPI001B7B7B5D|nr:FAD-dependent oxidoreductase [Anaerovibrio sp.]MBP3230668.1 FAD-dependent oxidoreductase [Anaerovibrio sp.]MBR2141867.1 FAD-dependent oxidoreductase [Anaerovibrio sp.]